MSESHCPLMPSAVEWWHVCRTRTSAAGHIVDTEGNGKLVAPRVLSLCPEAVRVVTRAAGSHWSKPNTFLAIKQLYQQHGVGTYSR